VRNDIGDLPARQAVDAGEHRDMRLKPGSQSRRGHAVGQRGQRALATDRARQPPAAVLEHLRRDHRQLPLLMHHPVAEALLAAAEAVSAPAPSR
jgi:hypothetical protein